MAVERDNVLSLLGWLADDSAVRSGHSSAEALVEKLAALVFHGDLDWPNRADQVDSYTERLSEWFARDSGHESQFVRLTAPDSDAGWCIDWFLSVVLEWEQWEAADEIDASPADEQVVGLPNPNSDGTPDTGFYRLDEATGEYLYSASADMRLGPAAPTRRPSGPAA